MCHYSTDRNPSIYPTVLHVHVFISMLQTSNSTQKFRKSFQLTGTGQPSKYWLRPPRYDETKSKFNVYWSARRLLRVSFSWYQHACHSGAIASKWARLVTWSASPKSCTPCLCHEFLEWRSYRCVRDVQTFKGHRIITASLKDADLYWRYPKTSVLRNFRQWMGENAVPYLLPAPVGWQTEWDPVSIWTGWWRDRAPPTEMNKHQFAAICTNSNVIWRQSSIK